MYELEKFLYYLRLDIKSSKLIQHIGNLDKFIYIKQNEYIVVNCQYLDVEYCERFIDYNPKAYFNSFIKFSYKAIAKADRLYYFKFNFNYNNIQTFIDVNLDTYRKGLRLLLKKRFENYTIEVVGTRIDVRFRSSIDRDVIPRLEKRIDEVVEEFNKYNRDMIPPQTNVIIENSGNKELLYTINFYNS